ncbi:MAG: hypothetical protein WC714_29240 [Candidatus Obscuribacterales bacterium]|jgi:hypothetical protein
MRLPEDDVGNVIQPGDQAVSSAVQTMVSGTIMFTVSGGPIDIIGLRSTLVTDNSSLAATMQYQFNPSVGSAQAISGASAALTSILAGTTVDLVPTALTTAPLVTLAGSGGLAVQSVLNKVRVPPGTLTAVFATSSVTGTFQHHMRYAKLAPGAAVV